MTSLSPTQIHASPAFDTKKDGTRVVLFLHGVFSAPGVSPVAHYKEDTQYYPLSLIFDPCMKLNGATTLIERWSEVFSSHFYGYKKLLHTVANRSLPLDRRLRCLRNLRMKFQVGDL
jgi:hypothetical protein